MGKTREALEIIRRIYDSGEGIGKIIVVDSKIMSLSNKLSYFLSGAKRIVPCDDENFSKDLASELERYLRVSGFDRQKLLEEDPTL